MSVRLDLNNTPDRWSDDSSVENKDKLAYNQRRTNWSIFHRLTNYWFKIMKHGVVDKKPERQLILSCSTSGKSTEMMSLNEIPFIIPRKLSDIRREPQNIDFERAKLRIRRMDEYLVSAEDEDEAKRQRHLDTSLGLQALALAVDTTRNISFREVFTTESYSKSSAPGDSGKHDTQNDQSLRSTQKIDAITDFQEAHDFFEFDNELIKHRKTLASKESAKPVDMLYLKFCLIFEIQRDPNESCLRILLHDIIFKFHLSDCRLRCQIHVKKPIEHELCFERIINDSHLKNTYSAQLVFYSGDWIVQQEVELSVVIKVEPLSLNKFIGPKFSDIACLHVKNVPHGASKIFLREMTPVHRPHKILSRGINVGQLEIEALYSSSQHQILIRILKVSHSQADRLLRAPETYVEIVFQDPFIIYDIQRTNVADRSLNPVFNEEFHFDVPQKKAVSDMTVDLIFLEKSSLHHQPDALGVLTLSKHTDWYPVRKFWAEVEENPEVTLKGSFLLEGNLDE